MSLHNIGQGRRWGAAWDLHGGPMYPLVYWAGLATFLVWSAVSAYSAFHGF
ncbi:MAG TPA: hypothetical protein VEK82_03010 [Stellaceae bacterium]|nr:hypothetical protein [Stellaceae bacterium]